MRRTGSRAVNRASVRCRTDTTISIRAQCNVAAQVPTMRNSDCPATFARRSSRDAEESACVDEHHEKRVLAKATALGISPGIAMTTPACAPNNDFQSTARTLRHPLRDSAEPVALLQELVRCATLAPNGHNAQPWMFELSPGRISIRPDFSRRTPVVDPDDHHIWVSLGCAIENMVIAAAALGKHAEVAFDVKGIQVTLDNALFCAVAASRRDIQAPVHARRIRRQAASQRRSRGIDSAPPIEVACVCCS